MVAAPDDPRTLGLPFDEWRQYQQDTISNISAAANVVPSVLLDGATGFGKSAVAAGLLQLEQNSGIILVQNLALQDQYAQNYPWMKSVKGQGSLKSQNPDGWRNEYREQRDRGLAARVMVTNYQWFLRAANLGNAPSQLDWVILDEAHAIEDEIGNFLTIDLDRKRFRSLGLELPLESDPMRLHDYSTEMLPRVRCAIEKCRRQKSLNDEVRGLERELKHIEWVFWLATQTMARWTVSERGQNIRLKPSTPGRLTRELLLRHARHHLLMSATILDHPTFATSLGLMEYHSIVIPHTVDPARRPIIYRPTVSMSLRNRNPDSLNKLVQGVDRIISVGGGERGVIHSGNYEITRYLMEHSQYRLLFVTHRDRTDRGTALDRFRQTSGGILLSPSMGVGVDFPYDQARWQIICKVPFADIGDPAVAKRKDSDPRWYERQAFTKLLQICGRIVRADDDFAKTIILDQNFDILMKCWDIAPQWFWDAFRRE